MTEYPLPLGGRMTGTQALTIVCEVCHTEAVIDSDDLSNEAMYECPKNTELGRLASPEPRCKGFATHKYEEGDVCGNCGKLGWFARELKGCCSRPCMLQAEYAKSLRGAA